MYDYVRGRKSYGVEFAAKILFLRSPEPKKWLRKIMYLSVCILLSLCEHEIGVKDTKSIFIQVS